MWNHLTPELQRAVRLAGQEAQREGHRLITSAHLLLAALDPGVASERSVPTVPNGAPPEDVTPDGAVEPETAAARALLALDIEPQLVRLAVQTRLRGTGRPGRAAKKMALSASGRRALESAALEARRLEAAHIGSEHLLLGIAAARWVGVPWFAVFFWPLRAIRLLPDNALLRVSIVAGVLAEFNLDLPTLRIAAAGDGGRDALPWTGEVQRTIDRAAKEARETGAGRVGAEHLWLGLLAEPGTAAMDLLELHGITVPVLEKHLRGALRSDDEVAGTKVRFTPEARRIFGAAARAARAGHRQLAGSDDLLSALAGIVPHANALDRAGKLLAAEGPSRAETALTAALAEMGRPPAYLREKLASAPPKPHGLVDADIATRLTWIIADLFQVPANQIAPDTPLISPARPHLASLDIFQRCAREFDISFTPTETREIKTASELGNAVVSKVLQKNKEGASQARSSSPPELSNYGVFLLSMVLGGTALSLTALYVTAKYVTWSVWSALIVVIVGGIVIAIPSLSPAGPAQIKARLTAYFAGIILLLFFLWLFGPSL